MRFLLFTILVLTSSCNLPLIQGKGPKSIVDTITGGDSSTIASPHVEESRIRADESKKTHVTQVGESCQTRLNANAYVFRLFMQALGRPPTPNELDKYLPDEEGEKMLTDERRADLAELVTEGELKNEFLSYGMRLFARRVGGAGSIKFESDFFGPFGLDDTIKDEFYQLLLSYVDAYSYREILLMNKVKVTSGTFEFYHSNEFPCQNPGEGVWGECVLDRRRSNFFGTIGFLNSNPSSFFASNNNYKRGAAIHAVLRGVRMLAQTDGPAGGSSSPLPSCLKSRDYRKVLNNASDPTKGSAARGSWAVVRQGSVCQGCHLDQMLGMASYVFRPFDKNGLLMNSTEFAESFMYADEIMKATASDIVNEIIEGQQIPVNFEFLQDLLVEVEQGQAECIVGAGNDQTVYVNSIKDLTEYMIGDGRILAEGLSHFIPSVISNISTPNQEIATAITRAYEKSRGKLIPVFRAYFDTETFSCATGVTQ